MHVSSETIPIYRHICITPLNFDCDTDQAGRQLYWIILLPRAEPAVKDTWCQKSQSETRHDFVHSRCCCLPTSLTPKPKQASPASSHFVLLTTPPRHPPHTPCATPSLLLFLLLPPHCCSPKIVIESTPTRKRVYSSSGAHTHATCALPRQQHRPPWGAKLAIHHHPPFLRRIARL